MTIAVIGAGLAGTTAAIEAASRGAAVTLYDARTSVGGRARTRHHQGYLLNQGAHALYVDGDAMTFLRQLGREPFGGVPDAAAGVAIAADTTGPLPTGLGSLLRTPVLRGDRFRLAALFARLGRLDPRDYRDVSVGEAVRTLLGSGPAARLGLALFRLSTYGHDPDRASADAGIVQLRYAQRHGVRYVDGGWQSIVDALLDEAVRRGVVVETGAKVTRVVAPARGAAPTAGVEVFVGGSRRVHEAAILAPGTPRHVAALLDDGSVDALRWADAARPSTVASLDVGLRTPWGEHPPFALGLDEPMYLSVHAPVARLAPDGHSLVHVGRYLHPDEEPDAARDRAACEALLDRLRPGWRDDADHVGFHPRLVAAADQPRAADGGLSGRPGPGVPGMKGVYVAGDWVGPTGVLADASVASGRAAAGLAVDHRARAEAHEPCPK